ncbi:MAG: hypothetical protein ABFD20_06770 [Anaerolineales bacterium]
MEHTTLFDKIYGCIIGGALGDGMGIPVEMMHYKDRGQVWPYHRYHPQSGSSKAGASLLRNHQARLAAVS